MAARRTKTDQAQMMQSFYQQHPKLFRKHCSTLLSKHTKCITEWGGTTDRNYHVTEEQFIRHLNGKISSILAKIVFDMIYSTTKNDAQKKADKRENAQETIRVVDVVQFCQMT
eukprot:60337_1